MGVGWRRAFCTAISGEKSRDIEKMEGREDEERKSPTGFKSCGKFGFFSNPSTPRSSPEDPTLTTLRGRAAAGAPDVDPRLLHCRTAPAGSLRFGLLGSRSNPSSPSSAPALYFRRKGFKSKSDGCGICSNSVMTGRKSSVYTAECGHAFHFACLSVHCSSLACPVCNTKSNGIPLHSTKMEKSAVIHENVASTSLRTQKAPTFRSYDDDEPLISPRFCRSSFYTIPEVEELEEEGEEFGEVTDALDEKHLCSGRLGRVQVRMLPERAIIWSNRSYETHVAALSVKAPSLQVGASHRAPVDLVMVLDLNCNASGDKLETLKAAMRLVISSLGSADRLSMVAFAENSKRVLPLRRMTTQGQRMARVIVDRLLCDQQGRCVGEALRKAAKVLEDRREKNPAASIILLSDLQKEALRVGDFYSELRRLTGCKIRLAQIEIPSSTVCRLAEDLFVKSLAGILSVVVQDLKIDLGFVSSASSAEIAAVYSCNKGQCTLLGLESVRLGDLYAQEERELLVEMRIPKPAIGSDHVMTVQCQYNDPASDKVVHCGDQKFLVHGPQVAAESPKPRIERLRNMFITTRAIAESKRLVDQDDYSSAFRFITSARALMMQSGSQTCDEYVKALEAESLEIQQRRQKKMEMELMRHSGHGYHESAKQLTSSSWREVEKLAKVAMTKRTWNRFSDLHGFENARF